MPPILYGAPHHDQPHIVLVRDRLHALAAAAEGLPFRDPPEMWPAWDDGEPSLMRPISRGVLWPGLEDITRDGPSANPCFIRLIVRTLGGPRVQDHRLTDTTPGRKFFGLEGTLNAALNLIGDDLELDPTPVAVMLVLDRLAAASRWCLEVGAGKDPGATTWPGPREHHDAAESLAAELAVVTLGGAEEQP